MIEQIDPAATEMYLAHAEPGMKRTYAERDWARLERALVEMETRLEVRELSLSKRQGEIES